MTDSLELQGFEQIEAMPGTALLRITARSAAPGARNGSPVLMVIDAKAVYRLVALPAPPDSTGLLRCAFRAPLAILEQPVSFALELADGSVIELPEPTRGGASNLARQAATEGEARREAAGAELREQRRLREEAEQRAGRAAALEERLRASIEAAAMLQVAGASARAEAADRTEQAASFEQMLASSKTAALGLQGALRTAREETAARDARIAELERELGAALTTIVELDAAARIAQAHAAELEELRSDAQGRISEREGAGGLGLRAEVEQAKADALAVARNYEQEAAARVEAEALAERLELELAGAREEAEAWRADAEKARMSAAPGLASSEKPARPGRKPRGSSQS